MRILFVVLSIITLALPIQAQETQTGSSSKAKDYIGGAFSPISINYGSSYSRQISTGTVIIEPNDYYPTSTNALNLFYGLAISDSAVFEISYNSFSGTHTNDATGLFWNSNGNPVATEITIDYTSYGFAFLSYIPLSAPKRRLYGRIGLELWDFEDVIDYTGGTAPLKETDSYDGTALSLQGGMEFDISDKLALRIGYHQYSLSDDEFENNIDISGLLVGIKSKF